VAEEMVFDAGGDVWCLVSLFHPSPLPASDEG
jgi:hypothetical protein